MKKLLLALILFSSTSLSANYLKTILSSKLTFESFEKTVDRARRIQQQKINGNYKSWINRDLDNLDNFEKEPAPFAEAVILPIESRFILIGDVHNSYEDLKSVLNSVEPDDQTYFVTLGDYCGRQEEGAVQVLYTLLLLFTERPNKTFLLPGNHDYGPFVIQEIYPAIFKLAKKAGLSSLEAKTVFRKIIGFFLLLPQNLLLGKYCDEEQKYQFICCAHAGPIGPEPQKFFKPANLKPLLERTCRETAVGKSFFYKLYNIPIHNWAIWSDYVAEIPEEYERYFKGLGPLYPSYRGGNETIRVISQDFMEIDYFEEYETDNFSIVGLVRGHGHLPAVQFLKEKIELSKMPRESLETINRSKEALDSASMELETKYGAWNKMFVNLSDNSWEPLEANYLYEVDKSIFSCTTAPYLWTGTDAYTPATYAILKSCLSGWYLSPATA